MPIEIKSAQTIHRDFFKGLDYFRKLCGSPCEISYLIYEGDHEFNLEGHQVLNFKHAAQIMT